MLIFVVGLFPNVFLAQIKGAAARVQDDFEARLQTSPGPRYYEGPIKLTAPRPEDPSVAAHASNGGGSAHEAAAGAP
jgi:hypothetical protein